MTTLATTDPRVISLMMMSIDDDVVVKLFGALVLLNIIAFGCGCNCCKCVGGCCEPDDKLLIPLGAIAVTGTDPAWVRTIPLLPVTTELGTVECTLFTLALMQKLLFDEVAVVVAAAVAEFSTSVFTPFSGIEILELRLGTKDVSTAVTLDKLLLLLLLLLQLLFTLLLLLLDTIVTKVLLLLMMLDETEAGVGTDEIVESVAAAVVMHEGAVDKLGEHVDAVDVIVNETRDEGVALRDGHVVVAVEHVDTAAIVETVVAVVLQTLAVTVAVTDKEAAGELEPAACLSLLVSSSLTVSALSLPESTEFTFDALLIPLALLLPLLELLHILVAVTDVIVTVVDAVTAAGDAADVVIVLVTGVVAIDAVDAVVVVVVVTLDTVVLALILLVLLLLLLLLPLLLLVLFEDEFVVTFDVVLFPNELFVEFAARSRPTVFCCCSRCSL